MGAFAVVISGTGGHGCSREVKSGGHVLGCQRPDCPDCIAREFVRRFKRNGVSELRAELIHWPGDFPGFTLEVKEGVVQQVGEIDLDALAKMDGSAPHIYVAGRYALLRRQDSTVIDDLVTGVRSGSF